MPFLGSWKDFLSRHVILTFLPTYVACIILAWIIIKAWKNPLRIGRDWHALAAMMLVYGILSGVPLLGILSRHYVFALARIMVFVALLIYANGAAPRLPFLESLQRWPGWRRLATLVFLLACISSSLVLAGKSAPRSFQLVYDLRNESPSYSRFLDSHWNRFMTEATHLIDTNRQRSQLSIWSTYSALLEAHYGIYSPAEDYIIHAAGPQRWHHYMDTFRSVNPEFVTTMTPVFSFEEWLQNERWEFFEEVLDNYEPLQTVEHAIIWQRKPGPWQAPSQNFDTIPPKEGFDRYALPVVRGSDRLGVVRIRYTVSNRWGWIPILGKTPRYLATIQGTPRDLAVSLPPYLSEFEFPIQLPLGHQVELHFAVASLLPDVGLRIDAVQVKVLDWQPSDASVFAFRGQHRY